jgi:hypothetical protein
VHRENIARGQKKIHHTKDRLFHLAGILGASDENDAAGEIRNNEGTRMGAVTLRHPLELGSGNHREFRLMASQFLGRHAHEQLLHEQGMPGVFSNNLHGKPVVVVSPGMQIENVKVALPHVSCDSRQQRFESCRIEGLVHFAPIHRVAGDGISYDELVSRGTPCARAGQRHQRAIIGQAGLTPGNRRLYQLWGRQVPVDVGAFHQLC